MISMHELRIVVDPNGDPPHNPLPADTNKAFREFMAARNDVYDALATLGAVGSCGRGRIVMIDGELDAEFDSYPDDYDFFLHEDMFTMHRYIILEIINLRHISPSLLLLLAASLKKNETWGILLGLLNGGCVIFSDHIVAMGEIMKSVTNLPALVEVIHTELSDYHKIQKSRQNEGDGPWVESPD